MRSGEGKREAEELRSGERCWSRESACEQNKKGAKGSRNKADNKARFSSTEHRGCETQTHIADDAIMYNVASGNRNAKRSPSSHFGSARLRRITYR
ncbi:unnamed protein product [Toxocara canis]|uniref:Uncharacterized protein n=1 Tax=Toxocara canis TaxID=6265 RepID=A0A183VA50_TOXCA|nr:unnamed protein product [Toxocara canis]